RSPPKRGHRTARPAYTRRWVLLNLFHNSKEGWRAPPHSRSKTLKYSSQDTEVSYAAHQGGSAQHSEERLVHDHRLEGCLLPRPNRTTPQAIPQVRLRGSGVPIQRTPIRPFPSAEGIHKVRRGSLRPI